MQISRPQKMLLTGAAVLGLAVGAAGIAGAANERFVVEFAHGHDRDGSPGGKRWQHPPHVSAHVGWLGIAATEPRVGRLPPGDRGIPEHLTTVGPALVVPRASVGLRHMLSPPKSSLTERSSNTASIASATSGAIESTRRLSKRLSSEIGSVLVTTTSRIGAFFSRSTAGPESNPCVAAMSTSVAPRSMQQVRRAHDRARGVDHVVDDHARAALDVADDFGRDRDVVRALRPALVDERDVGVEPVGEAAGELAATRVGRHDHRVAFDGSPTGTRASTGTAVRWSTGKSKKPWI